MYFVMPAILKEPQNKYHKEDTYWLGYLPNTILCFNEIIGIYSIVRCLAVDIYFFKINQFNQMSQN